LKTQEKAASSHSHAKPVIELTSVYKSYFMADMEVPILKDINITVREGEFVAIMGPSGSGKSTLMNLVGCLDVPTQGKVYLDGHDITRMSDNSLARIRGSLIGFVFQKFNLINSLSAWENVSLPLIFHGTGAAERKEIAMRILSSVGMADRVNNHPNQLSGGQQQRVAIARALAVSPQMILADEPTGNLDSTTGADILALFRKLNSEGKTIVLVTHDEGVAKNAQRIVRIRDGKIVSDEHITQSKERRKD
jgi:putative ABC transport system ATP-binding protein